MTLHGRAPRRVGRAALAGLLALPVLVSTLGGIPVTHAEDYRDEIADAKARQEQLQKQISSQQQTIGELRAAQGRLQSALTTTASELNGIHADQTLVRTEIAAATAALKVVEARYAKLVAELVHLDWTVGILEDELTQAEQDLEVRRALLGQRLAEAYRVQQTSLLEQLITADSFNSVLNDVGSHLRFGEQDAQLAAQIERDEAALQTLRRTTTAMRYRTDQLRIEVGQQAIAIREHRARLLSAEKRLEQLEAETKRLQAQQMEDYREIVSNKAEAEALLVAKQVAQSRLQDEIKRLIAEQQQRGSIPSEYNGLFVWPMDGRVSQEFGCTGFAWEPAYGSCAHFHKGIDVVALEGTEIKAAGDGVVVFVGYNPYDHPSDPAWIVLIAHSSNLITWYGHRQPIIPPGIKEGARVKKGDVIGYEGNTGHSTGPHLHWAVQLDGSFVNPRLFV